jgi:lysophospholipase L1-like esterase
MKARRSLSVAILFLVVPTLGAARHPDHWIGTWAAAPQAARPASAQTFHNQTLRLIVHVSAGGARLRVRLSNAFGDRPLKIDRARVARRMAAAEIDKASDRPVLFQQRGSVSVTPGSAVVSDPIDLDVPPMSDLAVSFFFSGEAVATTAHVLALQTSYVSAPGDFTSEAAFPIGKTIASWPFLTGVDISASPQAATIVAFGSSTTDGDGSTSDANRRWPDILAERLQKSAQRIEAGVLNEGIIGNRLLRGSPTQAASPFGPILGEAGLKRFDRDVLAQPAVKYVFVALGVNDILFPGFPFTPPSERVTSDEVVDGYRELIARAHKKGIRVIGTTIPPFEGATFSGAGLNVSFYTAEREDTRRAVNEWIRNSRAFDAVADFDEAVRDPSRPTRLLPAYAASDHLHVNDAGNVAQADSIQLALLLPLRRATTKKSDH